ncbi:Gfo/Idh/MocA family protein [Actinokineospora globicatena]|uniref:Gfo/Idh/MocA family protein n=1 Tax=Actinokineospora globicatena TaxID=103729 RepID=UPI0020A48E44|nr:Gfo/Idh/MocA family oxidoreductase [Actinokineospora globicatena]MCP2300987.1 putative dehydrogenase [Actinokineospora globicatena]GLW77382.1 dehydrogenase [Actinokineospora globicatena]GLW84216.1 dehydrogenase [Actinokineospora globicatena]
MGAGVVRVGLVGAGPWATAVHAPGLAGHPGTELTAVWARRPEAAAELGAPVVGDFDELLGLVDAVAFAVPPAVQGELAIRAAEAGKHVILEKPVAASVAEAERVVAAVERAGVASIVVFIRRFAPEVVSWLAEIHARQGWAGGSVRWLSGALLGGAYSHSPWRHTGGALADIGPHVIDLLDAALGPITDVLAAHRGKPDIWQLLLQHEAGPTSTATLSMALPTRPTVTELAVFGVNDLANLELDGRATPAQDSYALLLDDFVQMVHSGSTTHRVNAARGLHVQRILDKALRLTTS